MEGSVKAGIVCGACDRLNNPSRSTCEECGSELALLRGARPAEQKPKKKRATRSEASRSQNVDLPPQAAKGEVKGKPMEQARHYICKSCYSPVPSGHKFCGKCGTPAEDNIAGREPEFFGDMQTPGKAKLILIKGEGMDGISYHLNSTEHVAGRVQGAILFTEDKWLSPKHANFYYADGSLFVRDEGSVNGVFLCLRGPTNVASGTVFLAGEQLFRIEEIPSYDDEPDADGTYFFASPRRDPSFRIVQTLEGGGDGMVVNGKDNQVVIGREGCDMNFPNDPFISGMHLKVEVSGQALRIVDLGSKNGTYVRIVDEQKLNHGDYIFLGRQLLRVEITN